MTLSELIKLVEAASGPDRELDAEIGYVADWSRDGHDRTRYLHDTARNSFADIGKFTDVPAYTASLDAAMTLIPEGQDFTLHANTDDTSRAAIRKGETIGQFSYAATPALALVAASLRARSLMGEGQNG